VLAEGLAGWAWQSHEHVMLEERDGWARIRADEPARE
jgi:hypothetical protein